MIGGGANGTTLQTIQISRTSTFNRKMTMRGEMQKKSLRMQLHELSIQLRKKIKLAKRYDTNNFALRKKGADSKVNNDVESYI